MRRQTLIALTLICAVCAMSSAQDSTGILEATIRNMGNIKSIQYSGSGAVFTLGQSVSPDTPPDW